MEKGTMLPSVTGVYHSGGALGFKHSGTRTQCKKCLANITTTTTTKTCSEHVMITRGIAASLCRDAVFNTPELLEAMLLNLTPTDLLNARCVNPHWNAIIVTSPRIQRNLFRLAETTFTTWNLDDQDKVLSIDASGGKNRNAAEWTVPAKLNDLIFSISPPHLRGSLVERVKRCETIYLRASPNLANKATIHDKMLVCQPPSKEVEFNFYYDKSKTPKPGKKRFRFYGDDRISVRVVNEKGVTFGDVLRAFRAGVGPDSEDEPSSGFVIKIRSSTLWMGGVVFPTKEEVAVVEKSAG